MAEISNAFASSGSINDCTLSFKFDKVLVENNVKDIIQLREQYRCPCFRILIIGRANAGKTTILEKVCGVAKGTKPIIYGKDGKQA